MKSSKACWAAVHHLRYVTCGGGMRSAPHCPSPVEGLNPFGSEANLETALTPPDAHGTTMALGSKSLWSDF